MAYKPIMHPRISGHDKLHDGRARVDNYEAGKDGNLPKPKYADEESTAKYANENIDDIPKKEEEQSVEQSESTELRKDYKKEDMGEETIIKHKDETNQEFLRNNQELREQPMRKRKDKKDNKKSIEDAIKEAARN